jgi:hypothetical protein
MGRNRQSESFGIEVRGKQVMGSVTGDSLLLTGRGAFGFCIYFQVGPQGWRGQGSNSCS